LSRSLGDLFFSFGDGLTQAGDLLDIDAHHALRGAKDCLVLSGWNRLADLLDPLLVSAVVLTEEFLQRGRLGLLQLRQSRPAKDVPDTGIARRLEIRVFEMVAVNSYIRAGSQVLLFKIPASFAR
jgi:hypothetical protein